MDWVLTDNGLLRGMGDVGPPLQVDQHPHLLSIDVPGDGHPVSTGLVLLLNDTNLVLNLYWILYPQ